MRRADGRAMDERDSDMNETRRDREIREPLSRLGSLDELRALVVASHEAIAEELRGLTPRQALWKPVPAEWSAVEVADHVARGNGAFSSAIC